MVPGLSKMAGRKHANKNEIEIKKFVKMRTLLGPDEFMLKPTGILLTNLMEFEEVFKNCRVTKVKPKKGNGGMLIFDAAREI